MATLFVVTGGSEWELMVASSVDDPFSLTSTQWPTAGMSQLGNALSRKVKELWKMGSTKSNKGDEHV